MLYTFYPSKTSGALYHNVTTSWVYVLSGKPNDLANPKSANFIVFSSSPIRRLDGLMSLCMILLWWQWSKACIVWNITSLIWGIDIGTPFLSKYFFRSWLKYSKTMYNFSPFLPPWRTSKSLIIPGWSSSLSKAISLSVVLGIPSSLCSILTFLRAIIYKVHMISSVKIFL